MRKQIMGRGNYEFVEEHGASARIPPGEGDMILGEGYYVPYDDRITHVNANICVVGAPGSGKTRGVVLPNLLNGTGQSFIVSDPKGQLYRQWAGVLKEKGKEVYIVDFTALEKKSVGYNPFAFIRNSQDVVKFAHLVAYQKNTICNMDPFWDVCSETLLTAAIDYLKFYCPEHMQTLRNLAALIGMSNLKDSNDICQMDQIMDRVRRKNPEAFCVRQWEKIRCAAYKTYQSVMITTAAKLACLDLPEIERLTGGINNIDFRRMIEKPTVLFVTISDTDRSMDSIASLLMAQAYSELVYMADHNFADGRLPRHISFILDDYASSLQIPDLDKILAASRSRNISSMIILQNEGQLKADADVIIGSCDNYIYLGSGDLMTAKNVAAKADLDTYSVLNQQIGKCIVFRRGTKPKVNQNCFDLEKHKELYRRENEKMHERSWKS